MGLEFKANKQLILLVPIMHIILIFNCVVGHVSGKTTFTPLFVSVAVGLLNFMTIFYIYKTNKSSKIIRYVALTGLYANQVFLTVTTEVSPDNLIAFVILITMSLMFF